MLQKSRCQSLDPDRYVYGLPSAEQVDDDIMINRHDLSLYRRPLSWLAILDSRYSQ